MKIIVATAAIAAATAILASAPSLAHVDSPAGAGATVSNQTDNGGQQSPVNNIAAHFSGQGAWVVVDTLGGKDAIAAAQRAGVVLTIMGLGGAAVLLRMRLQAEALARSANRQLYS